MTEEDLFASIAKYALTVTPTGTLKGGWVAYNHDVTGRGRTPEDAVRDAASKVTGVAKASAENSRGTS